MSREMKKWQSFAASGSFPRSVSASSEGWMRTAAVRACWKPDTDLPGIRSRKRSSLMAESETSWFRISHAPLSLFRPALRASACHRSASSTVAS